MLCVPFFDFFNIDADDANAETIISVNLHKIVSFVFLYYSTDFMICQELFQKNLARAHEVGEPTPRTEQNRKEIGVLYRT